MSEDEAIEDQSVAGGRARLEAVVEGRVQGVGYRVFVLRKARDLGVVGWVANEPDGSVRCLAEGPRRALEDLLAALREGPRGAGVRGVHETWANPAGGFSRFDVRSGWHSGD
jgi:acylphosphatase